MLTAKKRSRIALGYKIQLCALILLTSYSTSLYPNNTQIPLSIIPTIATEPSPNSTWTVLLYADPTTDILGAVLKNIHDLLPAGSNQNAQIFVQLRAYLDESAGSDNRYTCWRYKIEQNNLVLIDQLQLTGDYTQDLTNAAHWAFGQTSTKHHALILSGHGFGPLEPTWNEHQHEWELEYDESMLTGCPMRPANDHEKVKKIRTLRGLLVNNLELKYLDNQNLISAVQNISHNLHKSLDILLLDLCMGAAIEHTYEIAPYVNYLVGCQNCELVDGLDCRKLAQHLTTSPLTPLELVQKITQDYQAYYQQISTQDSYTLAAIDCRKTAALTQKLNLLISKLNLILKANHKSNLLKESLRNLRRNTINFCLVPMYTDLYSILEKLTELLTKHKLFELAQLSEQTKQLVLDSVVSNVTGSQMTAAHGLSIYFPYAHIDSSYYKIPFAQVSNWLEFLELLTDAKFISNLEDENLSELGLE
jgi:hypothetical protein